jgi:cell pole-organizing protein PopZ
MSSPQHEPTMEEILASIRKIISEDNPPEAAPAAAAAPTPKPAPAATPAPAPTPPPAPEPVKQPEMEVLELTQEIVELAPEPAPPPPPAPEPVEEKTEEIIFEPITREPAQAAADNDIFSDRTRQAMEDTFDSIPDEAEPQYPRAERAPMAADGSSVESVFERAVRESFEPVLQKYLQDNSQLVIERMKPLIREWMDENFPALLENAVRGEVERIVKARTRR